MPSAETLDRFIARVESNAHAEAIEEFYTPGASMQENDAAPRIGRDTLAAHERGVLARMRSVRSTCVQPVFVNGDRVVIRWIFEFVTQTGAAIRIDELAYQRWEGSQIAEEKFYYDPAQLKLALASSFPGAGRGRSTPVNIINRKINGSAHRQKSSIGGPLRALSCQQPRQCLILVHCTRVGVI